MSNSEIDDYIRQLRDADPDVRCDAAGTLGAFGRDGVLAITPLYELCRDVDQAVRGEATHSLWEIACSCVGRVAAAEPLLIAGVPILIELLADPSSDVRASAVAVLTVLGPAAGSALPRLREMLDDGDTELQTEVSQAIQTISGTDTERT